MCGGSLSVVARQLKAQFLFWRICLWSLIYVFAPSLGYASEARDYPQFFQINAIEPLDDGSFALLGLLRTDPGTTKSGLLRVSASGDPIGDVVELKAPTGPNSSVIYSAVVAQGLAHLPGGDLVVSGWAVKDGTNTDFWLTRISPQGAEVWNVYWPDAKGHEEGQDKFYKVKRLANGNLVAVGRSQAGEKDKPSWGGAIWVDAATGQDLKNEKTGQLMHQFPNCPDNAQRCAFQDVTELDDGSLVVAGWVTKPKSDDIWMIKLSAEGKPIKSVVYGEAGNDVAFAVANVGDTVLVAGTGRKGKGTPPIISLTRFAGSLAKRAPLGIAATGGQARAVAALKLGKRFLLAGELVENSASKGFAANLPADASKAEVTETAPDDSDSQFYAIAASADGNVAMGGGAGSGQQRHAIAMFRTESAGQGCSASSVVATLPLDGTQPSVGGCATADKPARFKLGGSQPDGLLVVRSLSADVDAVLTQSDAIVDSSFNTKRAAEVLILPPGKQNLEVSISTSAPLASFQLAVAKRATPTGKVEEPEANEAEDQADAADEETEEATADSEQQDEPDEAGTAEEDTGSDDSEDASDDSDQSAQNGNAAQAADGPSVEEVRLADYALRALGYEVSGNPVELDGSVASFNSKAVLAFQASSGFPLTGELDDQQRTALLRAAAREVDNLAQAAAAKARQFTASSTPIKPADSNSEMESISGGVVESGNYGVAKYKDGREFSGLWQGALDEGPSPKMGVLQINADCSVSFGVAEGFDPAYDPDHPGHGTLGVLRRHGQVALDGDLSQVQPSTQCGQ